LIVLVLASDPDWHRLILRAGCHVWKPLLLGFSRFDCHLAAALRGMSKKTAKLDASAGWWIQDSIDTIRQDLT